MARPMRPMPRMPMRRAADFGAGEHFKRPTLPMPGPQPTLGFADPARGGKQQGPCVIGCRFVQHVRRVGGQHVGAACTLRDRCCCSRPRCWPRSSGVSTDRAMHHRRARSTSISAASASFRAAANSAGRQLTSSWLSTTSNVVAQLGDEFRKDTACDNDAPATLLGLLHFDCSTPARSAAARRRSRVKADDREHHEKSDHVGHCDVPAMAQPAPDRARFRIHARERDAG